MGIVEAVPALDCGTPLRQGPSSDSSPPRFSHAVLLTAAQICRGLVRLVFVVVTARVLGPESFGLYALLLATIEMLAVASGSGYMDYLTREAAADAAFGWGLALQLILLRCACTVVFIALGLVVLFLLHYPAIVVVSAACFSATLFFRTLSEAVQGVLRGIGHFVGFLIVEIAFGVGMVAGAAYLLLGMANLRAVLTAEIIASVLAAIAAIFFVVKIRPARRIYLPFRELVKTSAIFNTYAFAGNLYDRLDVLMLSTMAGDYVTGIYSSAYRPLGTAQLVPYGVLYSILPSLTREKYSDAERKRFENAMGLLLCLALLIVLGTTVFADTMVPLVLGRRFAEASAALKILIWAVIFRYVNYALNTVLLAVRKEKVFLITTLVCLAANIFGNLLLIPLFSWRAAAAMTIVTEVVLMLQNIYWLRRTTGAVPRPTGWLSASAVFTLAIVVSIIGTRLISPLFAGSVSLFLFGAYLIQTGTLTQIAATWETRRSGR